MAGTGASPADGEDFGGLLPSGTVFFAAGVSSQTLTILVSGDTAVEGDESFTVALANPTGSTLDGAASSAVGTIVNDDLPVITLGVSPAGVAEDGPANLVYTFTRTGPTSSALSVNYSVGGTATFNSDYTQSGAGSFTSSAGSITFGVGASSAVLTVDPSADASVESDETVAIALGSGTGYSVGTAGAVVGTIVNDDVPPPPPILSLSPVAVSNAEGNAGSTPFAFTVSRSGDLSGSSSAQWSVAGTGASQIGRAHV